MDSLELSTYVLLEPIVRREMEGFCERNEIKSIKDVRYLFAINYFLERKGSCYDADIALIWKHDNNKLPILGVRKYAYNMKNRKLIKYADRKLHPALKRNYIITERGYAVMDNYISMMNRLEKELTYNIKKFHAKAKERE